MPYLNTLKKMPHEESYLSVFSLETPLILQLMSLLFFIFVVCEVIGAVMSNSLSLLSDAAAMSWYVKSK